MLIRLSLFLACLLSVVPAMAEETCDFFNAVYEPASDQKPENNDLKFKLRFEKGDEGKASRSRFILVEAYNQENVKVSSIRFGNTWSNGASREGFSTAFGMYCNYGKDDETDCADMKGYAGFTLAYENKDGSDKPIEGAPDIIGTAKVDLSRSKGHPEYWDEYIKFFTVERVYPDFEGIWEWELSECTNRREFITPLECGSQNSEIVSFCENSFCSQQTWHMDFIVLDLQRYLPVGYKTTHWSCLEDKEGPKYVFYQTSGGNCPSCERYSIWNSEGEQEVDWKQYDQYIKDNGLKLDFWEDFKPVQLKEAE